MSVMDTLQAPAQDRSPASFRLVRYFTLTSLAAFLIVALALYWLERRERDTFTGTQREHSVFVSRLQADHARQQAAQARRDLVLMHEAEHVNLTRLLANALWDTHFAPFVTRAERVPIEHCRKLAMPQPLGGGAGSEAARTCFTEARRALLAIPEMVALDRKVSETMRKTSVFKVKVFDVRGLTVYSSDPAAIGEDKQANEGWWIAADGRPASELTHRDKFSAFEGVVENRDLISSYVPVFARDGATVIAVFEIYSDVTPFLARIREASEHVARVAASNEAQLAALDAGSEVKFRRSSYELYAAVATILALLYCALLFFVRRAQGLIDAEARERERSIRREERWHREKMSVLATMAATVGHEIGNPLATITAVAEDIAARRAQGACTQCRADLLLEQARRIAAKTRQMEDFAAARGEVVELVDVNDAVKAVCDFLSFDRRFSATALEFRPAPRLPARNVVADHLTEAVMNLLQACVDDEEGAIAPRRIVVETGSTGEDVLIRIRCEPDGAASGGAFAGARVESTRRRVESMGARLTLAPDACEIALPSAKVVQRVAANVGDAAVTAHP